MILLLDYFTLRGKNQSVNRDRLKIHHAIQHSKRELLSVRQLMLFIQNVPVEIQQQQQQTWQQLVHHQ